MLTRFRIRLWVLSTFFIFCILFTFAIVYWVYTNPTDIEFLKSLTTLLIIASLWELFVTLGMWIYMYWIGMESRKPLELLGALMSIFEPIVEFSMIFLEPVGDKIKEFLTWRKEDKLAYFYKRRDEIQERIQKLEREKVRPEDLARYRSARDIMVSEYTKLLERYGVSSEVIEALREYKLPYERKKKLRWPWSKKEVAEKAEAETCPTCREPIHGGYLCKCKARYHLKCLPKFCVLCGSEMK